MEKFDFNKAEQEIQHGYRRIEEVDINFLIPDIFGFPTMVPLSFYFGSIPRDFEAEGMALMEVLEGMGVSPFDAEKLIFEEPDTKATEA